MIAIIDYGMGNLRSVSKAFETIGAKVEVTNDPKVIAEAKAIVLPGVGAFARGMENLNKLDVGSAVYDAVKKNTPLLGICLGLQLLFTESREHGIHKGLDIIKGRVKRFDNGLKIPHMGWNTVDLQKTEDRRQRTEDRGHPSTSSLDKLGTSLGAGKTDIFKDIPNNSYFYFVHSYYVEPKDEDVIIGTTEYGLEFTSAINKGNIWGVQFHPEKSAELGLKILENFCRYVS